MNQNFIIHDAQGNILRTGDCPEEFLNLQVREDEFLLIGNADVRTDAVNPETGEVLRGVRTPPVPAVAPTQTPPPVIPVDQQLDLLWQAMDAGTFPKAEPFYSAIKAAKEA